MPSDKSDYYREVAKGLAASTKLYKVDSVVHVEDMSDIWFWQQILPKYRAGRYKFMRATTNEKGNRTTGCVQCLKYKDYLTQRFFICIDSDLRYLLEDNVSAGQGILQTYTYSWENHCVFASQLQHLFAEQTGKGEEFNFVVFLQTYSDIVYKPFLFMLYQEKSKQTVFSRDKFKQCISLQYRTGDELNNGNNLLQRLNKGLNESISDAMINSGFNFEEEAVLYAAKGVTVSNVYLYVRGHCLYNCLISIGKKLCNGTGVDFEQNILKTTLAFEQYAEISKIQKDVYFLKNLRIEL